MDDLKIATWYCAMHGSQDMQCCGRASLRYSIPVSDQLRSVPWNRRSEVRHALQQLHSECLEVRADMLKDWLSRPGTIAQLDSMIATLEHCKRQLGSAVEADRCPVCRATGTLICRRTPSGKSYGIDHARRPKTIRRDYRGVS
jgi:hypothetical protein